jgi:hypothetical protein
VHPWALLLCVSLLRRSSLLTGSQSIARAARGIIPQRESMAALAHRRTVRSSVGCRRVRPHAHMPS